MKVSAAGRKMIREFEGCVLHAYRDVVGIWTIGYGHTEGVRPGQRITQALADQMLDDDLDMIYGPRVEKLLRGAPTTQAQFDAMVSFAYNVGTGDWLYGRVDQYDKGGFEDSSVLKHHLRGDYEAAAASFKLWNRAGGRELAALTRRRATEAKLYLSQSPVSSIPDAENPDWHIREAQRLLGVKVDGDFGPISRQALADWRAAHP